ASPRSLSNLAGTSDCIVRGLHSRPGQSANYNATQPRDALGAIPMSVSYQAVGWNRTKKIYDSILASALLLYFALFVGVGSVVHPTASAETLLIRGLGTAALLLLHIILCIGPLCRLDRRFLPLLYNRRHLGVTMFVLAPGHGAFSIVQFHALGN